VDFDSVNLRAITFLILEAGSSVYNDGSTVVTVSGITFVGIVGVTAAGEGGGGGEAAVVVAVVLEVDVVLFETAAAIGAARRAAHPSLPKN